MSVAEVAAALSIDTSTVYKLIKRGDIPATELSFIRRNRYRIRREDVERLKRGE